MRDNDWRQIVEDTGEHGHAETLKNGEHVDIEIPINDFIDEQGTVLEEGPAYEATLKEFGEAPDSYNPGETRLVWRFLVTDPESDQQVEAAAFTSKKVSDGKYISYLVKYSKLLNGGVVPTKTAEKTDEQGNTVKVKQVDLEALEGKAARVTVKPYTNAAGITKNRVTNVLAPKGAAVTV
jgi:hypothetical protein